MFWQLAVYFAVGWLVDVLATLDAQAVIDKKPIASAVYTCVNTLISVFIVVNLVLSPERLWLVLAYAIGGSVGAYQAVRRTRRGDRTEPRQNSTNERPWWKRPDS